MSDKLFWEINKDELIETLNSNYYSGLTTVQADKLIKKFGLNSIKNKKKNTWINQFLSRFKNPLILLLVAVGIISFYLKETPSFIIISIITIISVTLDFYQEYKASIAIESLKRFVALKCIVIRSGQKKEIYVDKLVPGDIILLCAGDIVPADCRLVESRDLLVNQSSLTGETYHAEKVAQDLNISYSSKNIVNIKNSIFMGSIVIAGTAKAIVCCTGFKTEFGKIASIVTSKAIPTAFEVEIRDFGLFIMRISTLCSLLVLLINIILQKPLLESFIFAIVLAVGLTPELLPMVLTVTMATGVKNMAREKLIVKRLIAMQNLGSMNVLCMDKTGTLTEGTVVLKESINFEGINSEEVLRLAFLNSYFQQSNNGSLDKSIIAHKIFDISNYKKIDEVPFDFERRVLSVIVGNNEETMLIAKGSPETIITRCNYYKIFDEIKPLTPASRTKIENTYNSYFKQGYRTLAIAYKVIKADASKEFTTNDEYDLIFAGLITFIDPPKASAKEALRSLLANGIRIKVITGDSELVAKDICNKLDLDVRFSLSGNEIQSLDDATLVAKVEYTDLFFMISPTQKSRIIIALKQRGHVVGYLGDGVNDAPSLHIADIGISVANAVDVAKESSDIVMLNNELNILYRAIIIGRKTFANIMKYIMMATSSNFGNMISMALSPMFLPFLPMLPLQILINNLLYDISEIPLPLDNVDEDYLKKPRKLNIQLIYKFMLIFGSISSIFDLITFYILFYVIGVEVDIFRTVWFLQSLSSQILVIFILRTNNDLLKSKPSPALMFTTIAVIVFAIILTYSSVSSYLGFVSLNADLLLFTIVMVFAYLFIILIIKRKVLRDYKILN